MQIQPYLFFEGRCDEAVEFYRTALGATVTGLMRYKESPEQSETPHGAGDKVMHVSFQIGATTVMASDGRCSGKPSFQGFRAHAHHQGRDRGGADVCGSLGRRTGAHGDGQDVLFRCASAWSATVLACSGWFTWRRRPDFSCWNTSPKRRGDCTAHSRLIVVLKANDVSAR